MPLVNYSAHVQQTQHDGMVAGVISAKLAETANRTFRHYG